MVVFVDVGIVINDISIMLIYSVGFGVYWFLLIGLVRFYVVRGFVLDENIW